jgi:hypothetical protein
MINFDSTHFRDAKLAGTKYSKECSLILTNRDFNEINSALLKTIPEDLIDKMGIFQIKFQDIPIDELWKNSEFVRFRQVVGLHKKTTNINHLRYHKIVIFDKDLEEYIIEIFKKYWDQLVENNELVKRLSSPIIKVIKIGYETTEKPKFFYSGKSFYKFESENDMTKYKLYYYMGLGRSDGSYVYDDRVYIWQ